MRKGSFGPNATLFHLDQAGDCHTFPMDLDAAARDYRRAVVAIETTRKAAARRVSEARERAEQKRLTLAAAMVEAARDGVRPVEIERRTGYTKERVRQILRAGGIEPE